MASKKRKRVLTNRLRSIEERMSDKLMQIHGYSPKEAWAEIRLMEMKREMRQIPMK